MMFYQGAGISPGERGTYLHSTTTTATFMISLSFNISIWTFEKQKQILPGRIQEATTQVDSSPWDMITHGNAGLAYRSCFSVTNGGKLPSIVDSLD